MSPMRWVVVTYGSGSTGTVVYTLMVVQRVGLRESRRSMAFL